MLAETWLENYETYQSSKFGFIFANWPSGSRCEPLVLQGKKIVSSYNTLVSLIFCIAAFFNSTDVLNREPPHFAVPDPPIEPLILMVENCNRLALLGRQIPIGRSKRIHGENAVCAADHRARRRARRGRLRCGAGGLIRN